MNVESLLRRSDPARQLEVPDADSFVADRIHRELLARADQVPEPGSRFWSRRSVRLPAAALLAVGVTTALVVGLLPGTIGTPRSAAAAALNHLASQAAQQPTSLASGQYFYTDIEQPTTITTASGLPGGPYTFYESGVVQTWVAADGSGRRVTTTDPTPRFFSAAEQAKWMAAGEPPLVTAPNPQPTQTFGPGSAAEVNGPIPLYDVSTLPTDPDALAAALGKDVPGSGDLGALPPGIAALDVESNLFERTAALLQGPDVGETPALRSALFEVLASVPGVQLLGTVTDPAGQTGLGIQLVESRPAGIATITCGPGTPGQPSPGVTIHRTGTGVTVVAGPSSGGEDTTTVTQPYPAISRTIRLVVDPETTTLLSTETTDSPSVLPANIDPCSSSPAANQTETVTPDWKVILAEGVVGSDTATTGAGPT
jgi:hypothetical protein